MNVHKKMGLGDSLTDRSTAIRELTDDELKVVSGGETGTGGGEGGTGGGEG